MKTHDVNPYRNAMKEDRVHSGFTYQHYSDTTCILECADHCHEGTEQEIKTFIDRRIQALTGIGLMRQADGENKAVDHIIDSLMRSVGVSISTFEFQGPDYYRNEVRHRYGAEYKGTDGQIMMAFSKLVETTDLDQAGVDNKLIESLYQSQKIAELKDLPVSRQRGLGALGALLCNLYEDIKNNELDTNQLAVLEVLLAIDTNDKQFARDIINAFRRAFRKV